MKITIHSTFEGDWAGSEMLWYSVSLLALKSRHDVQICINGNEPMNYRIVELEKAGAKINRRKKHWLSHFRIAHRFLRPSFIKKLQNFRPDVFLMSQGGCFEFLYNTPVFTFLQKENIPFFLISHCVVPTGDILDNWSRQTLESFLAKWQKFYFVAERNKKIAERQAAMKLNNTELISNSLNLKNVKKQDWPAEKILQLCCIGHYECSIKGQDVLLETLAENELRDFKYHLNFFGKGPHKDHLQQLIKFYQLEDRVTINEYAIDVDKIWERHHVLILPSVYEGTPLVVQECMMKGRPVLATDVGDVSRFVIEDITGFLAATCSVKELKKALLKLFKMPLPALQQMGEDANKNACAIIDFNVAEKIFNDMSMSAYNHNKI